MQLQLFKDFTFIVVQLFITNCIIKFLSYININKKIFYFIPIFHVPTNFNSFYIKNVYTTYFFLKMMNKRFLSTILEIASYKYSATVNIYGEFQISSIIFFCFIIILGLKRTLLKTHYLNRSLATLKIIKVVSREVSLIFYKLLCGILLMNVGV